MKYQTIAALYLGLSVSSVMAADLPSRHYLNLVTAKKVMQAAEQKAQKEGWPAVIAIVDDAGNPLLQERMDNADVPAGVILAPGKARTAALFHRPSSDLEKALNGTRPAVGSAKDFIMMSGGLPLSWQGQIVGAIGVSSATPEHDVEIAQAGVAALTP